MTTALDSRGLVLVTGSPGSGKTTVGDELRRRGYGVFDVDRLARWFENASGAEVSMPSYRDDAWFAEHTYRLPVETVRRIADEAAGLTFICGTTGNEAEIWDLFDAVVSLSVDAPTLRRRLAGRPGGFGSTRAELGRVLTWHANVDTDNARYGALLIDATAPIAQVASEILTTLARRNLSHEQ
ncbi:AAA family ATPase [Kribbella sp. NPDC004875]|uniref:AAA family ATPase n=1 Tax=Kribbella sp. NPDC004875 TaxID=3364107 RepID=UPI0036B7AFC7